MIERAIQRAIEKRIKRGYDYTYWAIDIHDTLVPSTYTYPNKYDYHKYDYMLKSMIFLSAMKDMKIILWSCTPRDKVQEVIDDLKTYGINIDYFNENPECEPLSMQDFSGKFYFDIGVDDKFGFDPETDWKLIYSHVRTIRSFGLEEYLERVKNNEISIRVDDDGKLKEI